MCYTGVCPSELSSGKCGHRISYVDRPCNFDSLDEYYFVKEEAEKGRLENIYEKQKRRKYEDDIR